MFWGLIMEPERRYSQKVKKSFHISMAALDLGSSDDEPAQVMCGYDGRNYLLCTLQKPNVLQCALDLEFETGTEVSFTSNGKAHIHLTGYLTDTDKDGLSLEDLMEEQEDEEVVEEEEEVLTGKKKKRKDAEKNEPPSKKAKLLNGFSVDQGEEEESDDPDFDEEESGSEEAESEESSDEGEEEEDDDEGEEEEVDAEEQEPVAQKISKKEKKKANKASPEINGEQQKKKQDEQPQKPQKRVLKGGVIVEDIKEGSGPPAKAGRFITVYYEGRLEKNNKVFDSTNKGPGFKFRLGIGEVIKGWDTGLVGMKMGGIRKIICPPHTAYGAKGSPPAVPPNSTLVFTVTLKKMN